MFIDDGKILLNLPMEALADTYVEVLTAGDNASKARGLGPIAENEMFGKSIMLFEGVSRENLEGLGELRTPAIADLFVAKIKGARQ
jgi:ABC-2 type transport system ATP-binding protein